MTQTVAVGCSLTRCALGASYVTISMDPHLTADPNTGFKRRNSSMIILRLRSSLRAEGSHAPLLCRSSLIKFNVFYTWPLLHPGISTLLWGFEFVE